MNQKVFRADFASGTTPASKGSTDYVGQRATKLGTFFDRITGCHVTLEAPHPHHRHGRQYRVIIDMTVPGGEPPRGQHPTTHPSTPISMPQPTTPPPPPHAR